MSPSSSAPTQDLAQPGSHAQAHPSLPYTASLSGTDRAPQVVLRFPFTARHQATGLPLVEWVRKAPGRHWDAEHNWWVVTAFGPGKDADAVLAHAGFAVDLHGGLPGVPLDPSLWGVTSLNQLKAPLCRASLERPGTALVRPRFLGWDATRELLGGASRWDKSTGRFEVPLTDLLAGGEPKRGLIVEPRTVVAAQQMLLGGPVDLDADADASAAVLANSSGLDGSHLPDLERLVEAVGDIPDWLGMTPRPYQRLGAVAVASGRTMLCDPTGLGKTLTILAAAAIRDAQRVLLIVPPVVVTHWGRETARCGLGTLLGPRGKPMTGLDATPSVPGSPYDGRPIVTIRAGRKEPDLPETGVVIVPDSLLAARPALAEKIIAWSPDLLAYDEAHRARTWRSKRSEVVREICGLIRPDALRIASTATPMDGSPAELASLLAISGHLDPVFGGYDAFTGGYCVRNHFKALVARASALPQLREILATRVWVRRLKDEVLSELPEKARVARFVDVDLGGFREAHTEVCTKIEEWLGSYEDEHGEPPAPAVVKEWAQQQIGLISPLRKAAGLAKVPVALDMVSEWIEENVAVNVDGTFTCDRPLVVWAHHQEVVAALAAQVTNHVKTREVEMVTVIDGSTSTGNRTKLVDAFQDGRIPVLVCSITAAGVGITLTRGSDALFVETDWTPSVVSQAEDRMHRIGQDRGVLCTTLIAEGTLDLRIQAVLERKAQDINKTFTGDARVTVVGDAGGASDISPSEIIVGLAFDVAARHGRKRSKVA